MSAREEWLDVVDLLAASEVMEWRDHPVIPRLWWIHPPTPGVRKADWAPTHSISDAWKLVEAMKGPPTDEPAWSWGVEIVWIEDGPDRTGWHVTIQGHESPVCDSAPLAITLAALKAVGCEIPEEPTDG